MRHVTTDWPISDEWQLLPGLTFLLCTPAIALAKLHMQSCLKYTHWMSLIQRKLQANERTQVICHHSSTSENSTYVGSLCGLRFLVQLVIELFMAACIWHTANDTWCRPSWLFLLYIHIYKYIWPTVLWCHTVSRNFLIRAGRVCLTNQTEYA